MTKKIPTVVSLFSGAGGFDIGLESSGFKTIATVDLEQDCVNTLLAAKGSGIKSPAGRRFLKDAKIIRADATSLDPIELIPRGASKDWRPDLLVGGPPCQSYSSAGKRLSMHDARGKLFEHFVRIAAALKPRYICFENVRGLVTARGFDGEPGGALIAVKAAFEKIGYATSFQLLNAADFGSYQHRVRCIMIASSDSPLPDFPAPVLAKNGFGGLPAWKTLAEFLDQNPPIESEIVRPTKRAESMLRNIPCGSGVRSPGTREVTRPGGHWGYRQGMFIADPLKPARTVTSSTGQDWIRLPDGSLQRLTMTQCAALQGFPADWPFTGSAQSRFRQIGNAIPSVFGVALGEVLIKSLSRPVTERPISRPLPDAFTAAIAYTKRDETRNGASRRSKSRVRSISRVA